MSDKNEALIEVYAKNGRGVEKTYGIHKDISKAREQIKGIRKYYGNKVQIGMRHTSSKALHQTIKKALAKISEMAKCR